MQQPLQAKFCLPDQRIQLIICRWYRCFISRADLQMILQVFADSRQIMNDRDAVFFNTSPGPMPDS